MTHNSLIKICGIEPPLIRDPLLKFCFFCQPKVYLSVNQPFWEILQRRSYAIPQMSRFPPPSPQVVQVK